MDSAPTSLAIDAGSALVKASVTDVDGKIRRLSLGGYRLPTMASISDAAVVLGDRIGGDDASLYLGSAFSSIGVIHERPIAPRDAFVYHLVRYAMKAVKKRAGCSDINVAIVDNAGLPVTQCCLTRAAIAAGARTACVISRWEAIASYVESIDDPGLPAAAVGYIDWGAQALTFSAPDSDGADRAELVVDTVGAAAIERKVYDRLMPAGPTADLRLTAADLANFRADLSYRFLTGIALTDELTHVGCGMDRMPLVGLDSFYHTVADDLLEASVDSIDRWKSSLSDLPSHWIVAGGVPERSWATGLLVARLSPILGTIQPLGALAYAASNGAATLLCRDDGSLSDDAWETQLGKSLGVRLGGKGQRTVEVVGSNTALPVTTSIECDLDGADCSEVAVLSRDPTSGREETVGVLTLSRKSFDLSGFARPRELRLSVSRDRAVSLQLTVDETVVASDRFYLGIGWERFRSEACDREQFQERPMLVRN